MNKDVAFHFRCYDDRNYASFPEDFILRALLVSGHAVESEVYNGDLNFLQLLSDLNGPDFQTVLFREMLTSCHLQTRDPLVLASSYVIRLANLPGEVETLLHLSLAQHDEYLGKVDVCVRENLLHRYFYQHCLIGLGRVSLPAAKFVVNHPVQDAENWDTCRAAKFERFGYNTRFAQIGELFHSEYVDSDVAEIRGYFQGLRAEFGV